MITVILVVLLVLLLVGAVPVWPHAVNWGYAPVSVLSVLLVIVLILMLMGWRL
jgi:Protein of unknown function (DUF3309)